MGGGREWEILELSSGLFVREEDGELVDDEKRMESTKRLVF